MASSIYNYRRRRRRVAAAVASGNGCAESATAGRSVASFRFLLWIHTNSEQCETIYNLSVLRINILCYNPPGHNPKEIALSD